MSLYVFVQCEIVRLHVISWKRISLNPPVTKDLPATVADQLIFSALAILRQSDSTCTCHADVHKGTEPWGLKPPDPPGQKKCRYHQHSEFEAPSWKWLLPSGYD